MLLAEETEENMRNVYMNEVMPADNEPGEGKCKKPFVLIILLISDMLL